MTDKLLRINKVMDMTGKSRSAIYADIANKCFPNSILIGARSVAWAESDIVAWVQSKIDAAKSKSKVIKYWAEAEKNAIKQYRLNKQLAEEI